MVGIFSKLETKIYSLIITEPWKPTSPWRIWYNVILNSDGNRLKLQTYFAARADYGKMYIQVSPA